MKRLVKMGVDVRLSSPVAEITSDAVLLKDGTLIPTETVIWTAGVRGKLEADVVGLPIARNGQILVSPTLQVEAHPNIYVVGDLARLEGDKNRLPMIAPVATQQGAHAGRNIVRQISGLPPKAFQYRDRGKMVTIGRNYGAARIVRMELHWISSLGHLACCASLQFDRLSQSHLRLDRLGLGLLLHRTRHQAHRPKGTHAILIVMHRRQIIPHFQTNNERILDSATQSSHEPQSVGT